MFKQSQKNETEVKRGLLTTVFLVITVFVAFQAVRQNNPLLIGGIITFPLLAWLLGNPSALLVGLFLTGAAGLLLPGLPGGLTLRHLFQAVIIGWAIIYTALSGVRGREKDPVTAILFLFLLNLALIMAVRGFGLGALGGSVYGGTAYILLALNFLFYSAAIKINLEEKHLRLIFFGTLICSVIPFLAQVSVYVTGGGTAFLSNFIKIYEVKAVSDALMEGQTSGDVRWASISGIRQALITIALVLPAVRKRKPVFWGLIAIAFYAALVTGFRGQIIGMGAVVFAWLIYDSKNRKQTFFGLLALGLLGWVLALVVIPFLPLMAQRALSFLPFATDRIADKMMLRGAEGSIDFRIDIWKMAWDELPRYLLIGRGFVEDITQFAWLQGHWYQSVDFFYYMHNYHSGPLSLLVDFGLAGLVLGVAFMWVVASRSVKTVRRFCIGKNDLIARYYAFLTIQFIYFCFSYFFIFGDVRESFPFMILVAVQLKIFGRELQRRDALPAERVPSVSAKGGYAAGRNLPVR